MKAILSFFFLVQFSFAASFLAKVKPGQNQQVLFQTLRNVKNVETFSTVFGEFAEFEADEQVVASLRSHQGIEYVERNDQHYIDPIEDQSEGNYQPSDDLYSQQWALKNTGEVNDPPSPIFEFLKELFGIDLGIDTDKGKAGVDMNAEKAWTLMTGDPRLKIAIIDTGVDYTHPDLAGNMWVNKAEANGLPGVDDDQNGFVDDIHGYDFANNDGDPMDRHSHGTHCAGVIAAAHNNKGIVGLMSEVQIVAIKFLGRFGSGDTSDAIKSIDYAIKAGVHIMSNSWGGGLYKQAVFDAITAAKNHGIVFVAAAGNNGKNNDHKAFYPASYDVENIIRVGAISSSGKKASFSNYGAKMVDVFAPGVKILSTVRGGRYKKYSGTSMATPYVSAALGLLLASEMNNSESLMSFGEIRKRLVTTSVPEPGLGNYSLSGGRVDAYRLLLGE